jgi:hypothetical protein
VFYVVCAVVGLFCVIALGFGPLFFVLVGAALAILSFRRRFRRWWGLPLAAAGASLVMSVTLGWRWQSVLEVFAGTFGLVAMARVAGRALDRRAASPGRADALDADPGGRTATVDQEIGGGVNETR